MILKYYSNGPVTVTLDSNREPIVAGFGAGAKGPASGIFYQG